MEKVEYGGRKFDLKGLYRIIIKYAVPVNMFILFLTSSWILIFDVPIIGYVAEIVLPSSKK